MATGDHNMHARLSCAASAAAFPEEKPLLGNIDHIQLRGTILSAKFGKMKIRKLASLIPFNGPGHGDERVPWASYLVARRCIPILDRIIAKCPAILSKFQAETDIHRTLDLEILAEVVYGIPYVTDGDDVAHRVNNFKLFLNYLKRRGVEVDWIEKRFLQIVAEHRDSLAQRQAELGRKLEELSHELGDLNNKIESVDNELKKLEGISGDIHTKPSNACAGLLADFPVGQPSSGNDDHNQLQGTKSFALQPDSSKKIFSRDSLIPYNGPGHGDERVPWARYLVAQKWIPQLDWIAERYPETLSNFRAVMTNLESVCLETLACVVYGLWHLPVGNIDQDQLVVFKQYVCDIKFFRMEVEWIEKRFLLIAALVLKKYKSADHQVHKELREVQEVIAKMDSLTAEAEDSVIKGLL